MFHVNFVKEHGTICRAHLAHSIIPSLHDPWDIQTTRAQPRCQSTQFLLECPEYGCKKRATTGSILGLRALRVPGQYTRRHGILCREAGIASFTNVHVQDNDVFVPELN
jgi:hypothetical protein